MSDERDSSGYFDFAERITVIIERECEVVAQATNCPEIAIKVSIACVCVCLSLCKDAAADHANQQVL